MTFPLDDATAYNLFGPNAPKPAPPSPTAPLDEGYLYSTYSPAAGAVRTSYGPHGGIVNYANGADPNGYYWVDDGSRDGYWYRPEDGATWRQTAASRAEDAAIAHAREVAPGIAKPLTNAPVVGPPMTKDAALAAALGSPSLSAPPTTGTTTTYTLPGGSASIPQGGLPSGVLWEPGNPDAFDPLQRQGHYAFDTPLPASQLDIKPRAGDSLGGVFADLAGSLVPRESAETIASPLGHVPFAGGFLQDTGADLIQNITSPLGIAGFAVGGPAANLAAEVGAAVLPNLGEAAGLPSWAQVPLSVVGGVLGGGGYALKGLPDVGMPTARPAPSTYIDEYVKPRFPETPMTRQAVEEAAPIIDSSAARELNDSIVVVQAAKDPEAAARQAFEFPVEEPVPIRLRQPDPPPQPRAPVQGPAPDPRITVDTSTPKIEGEIGPKKFNWRDTNQIAVTVDETPVGTITRHGVGDTTHYTATYRTPRGMEVPLLGAHGRPRLFLTQAGASGPVKARNAIVNASEQARARTSPAPAAGALDDAPRAAVARGADGPVSELEAQLRGTLEMVQARRGVAPPKPEIVDARGPLEARTTVQPDAARPTFRTGDVIRDRRTGQLYEVSSAGEKGGHMTLSQVGGRRLASGRAGVFRGGYRHYEVVAAGEVPVDQLSYRAVLRRAQDEGLLPGDSATLQEMYAAAGTPREAPIRARVEAELKAIEAGRTAEAARSAREASAAMSAPAYRNGASKAAAGVATPGEVEALEALERHVREAVGANGIDESYPPGYSAPSGFQRVTTDEDAAMHWSLVERDFNEKLKAERAGSRISRAKDRAGRVAVEAANAPRTLKANLDLSFVRRQGGALNAGAFFVSPRAAARMWKSTARSMWESLRRPSVAAEIQQEILSKPRPGLYIAPLDGAAPLTLREEAMLGSFVTRGSRNPLRVTSNANVVYLNSQRAAFYDMVEAAWAASGRTPTAKELDFLANFTNHATGRGTARWLDNLGPALAIPLFAPRWTVSRFQLLADPFVAPTMRTRFLAARVAGANLGMQAATAIGIGVMLERFGVDYEWDWRSSDFGRIKIPTPVGTAVLDTTAGMNSPIRFIAQLAYGQYKGATGIRERSQQETIIRFLRSKASPIGGEVFDWFAKQIPGLEDFTYDPEPGGLADLPGLDRLPWMADVANMFAPISLDNAVRYLTMANSPATYVTAIGLILSELFGDGADYRGLSAWDKRDQQIAADPELAQYRREGVETIRGYDDLNEAGKLRARQKYPVEAFGSASKLRESQVQWAKDGMNERLQGVEDILSNSRNPYYKGKHAYSSEPGKQAREDVKRIQAEFSAQLDLIYRDAGERPPSVVQRWREVIEANTWPNKIDVDWEPVDAWVATLSPAKRKELDDSLAVARAGKSGIVREIADAAAAVGASGFWETDSAAWKGVVDAGMFPEAEAFTSYYEYRRDWVSKRAAEIAEQDIATESDALDAARKEFDKTPVAKAYGAEKEKAVLDWVLDNPDVAKTAAQWDYYSPTDTTRGFLATGDPNQIVTRRQEIDALDTVSRTVINTPQGEARYSDWQTSWWRDYAEKNGVTGPNGEPATQYKTFEQFRDAGGVIDGGAGWNDSISKAEYDANPDAYLRVQTGTNKGGSPSYSYLNPKGKAQVEAILALYRANPDAVREAYRLGLTGFAPGTDLSRAEVAWLESQGVKLE